MRFGNTKPFLHIGGLHYLSLRVDVKSKAPNKLSNEKKTQDLIIFTVRQIVEKT